MNEQKLQAILVGMQIHQVSWSLHLFETLPSTNQTLWQLIEQGAEPGAVVIATQQSAGRGQWGHQWFSPPGGLYISVAIAPNLPAQLSYQLTLCSAWGIATALQNCGIPVKLKWPNDLMLEKRKLGGILTETKVQQGRITQAVVGVGINWDNSVPDTGINLKSLLLNQLATSIDSLEMLAAVTLLGIIHGNYVCSRSGIESLLPSYQKLLINMGSSVSVNGRCGTIVGVTASGGLRVRINEPDAQSVNALEICLDPGTISLGYI